MRRMRSDRRGVAGFFEEIPAAAVAIVALLLFFSALTTGLANLSTQQNGNNFSDQAEVFLEGLVSYQNLTLFGQPGVFDYFAMEALTIQNLTYNFHPEFQYEVTITDISTYPFPFPTKSLETSTFPYNPSGLQQGWVRDTTTVTVWIPNYPHDEYRTSTLAVVIWS